MDGYVKIIEFQRNGGIVPIGKITENGNRENIKVEGNYNIDINIFAVDRFESLLSSYEREQYFVEARLAKRTVIPQHHDRAYERMLETIGIIENRGLADRMRVFKRGYSKEIPELVHISGDGKYKSVVDAVIAERAQNRKELLRNPERYFRRIAELKQRAIASNNMELVERLEIIKNEFDNELTNDLSLGR